MFVFYHNLLFELSSIRNVLDLYDVTWNKHASTKTYTKVPTHTLSDNLGEGSNFNTLVRRRRLTLRKIWFPLNCPPLMSTFSAMVVADTRQFTNPWWTRAGPKDPQDRHRSRTLKSWKMYLLELRPGKRQLHEVHVVLQAPDELTRLPCSLLGPSFALEAFGPRTKPMASTTIQLLSRGLWPRSDSTKTRHPSIRRTTTPPNRSC